MSASASLRELDELLESKPFIDSKLVSRFESVAANHTSHAAYQLYHGLYFSTLGKISTCFEAIGDLMSSIHDGLESSDATSCASEYQRDFNAIERILENDLTPPFKQLESDSKHNFTRKYLIYNVQFIQMLLPQLKRFVDWLQDSAQGFTRVLQPLLQAVQNASASSSTPSNSAASSRTTLRMELSSASHIHFILANDPSKDKPQILHAFHDDFAGFLPLLGEREVDLLMENNGDSSSLESKETLAGMTIVSGFFKGSSKLLHSLLCLFQACLLFTAIEARWLEHRDLPSASDTFPHSVSIFNRLLRAFLERYVDALRIAEKAAEDEASKQKIQAADKELDDLLKELEESAQKAKEEQEKKERQQAESMAELDALLAQLDAPAPPQPPKPSQSETLDELDELLAQLNAPAVAPGAPSSAAEKLEEDEPKKERKQKQVATPELESEQSDVEDWGDEEADEEPIAEPSRQEEAYQIENEDAPGGGAPQPSFAASAPAPPPSFPSAAPSSFASAAPMPAPPPSFAASAPMPGPSPSFAMGPPSAGPMPGPAPPSAAAAPMPPPPGAVAPPQQQQQFSAPVPMPAPLAAPTSSARPGAAFPTSSMKPSSSTLSSAISSGPALSRREAPAPSKKAAASQKSSASQKLSSLSRDKAMEKEAPSRKSEILDEAPAPMKRKRQMASAAAAPEPMPSSVSLSSMADMAEAMPAPTSSSIALDMPVSAASSSSIMLEEEAIPISSIQLADVSSSAAADEDLAAPLAPEMLRSSSLEVAIEVDEDARESRARELRKPLPMDDMLRETDMIMKENIAQVLERGERLDSLVEKSEALEAESRQFKAQAKKTSAIGGLFRKDEPDATAAKAKAAADKKAKEEAEKKRKAEEKKKKKKKKPKIDNIFADIENAFNGMSAIMVKVTYFKKLEPCFPFLHILYVILFCIPLIILTYLGISLFTLVILFPAVFLLLLVRTQTVERKVETGFAVRQAVLAAETVQEKSVRFVNLVLRALPMAAFLIAWPIVSVYVIIPHSRNTVGIDTVTIGVFLVLMLIIQILGTIRSARSFLEKMIALHNERIDEWYKKQNNGVLPPEILQIKDAPVEYDSDGEELPKKVVAFAAPSSPVFFSENLTKGSTFRWNNIHNLIAVVSIIIEAAQLLLFSVQTLEASTMQTNRDTAAASTATGTTPDPNATSDSSSDTSGSFGPKIMPVLFINLASYLANNLVYVYAFSGVAVVLLLLLVVLVQFLKELLAFGRAKSSQQRNDVFFFSVIGSIVYGHGEVKNVSSLVSNVIALLADTLFLIVCGKLMTVFTCVAPTDTQPALLLIDPSMVCWESEHQFLAVISLISFAYYLPLSAMIAPMLAEAESDIPPVPGSKEALEPPKPPKKDVKFVQPFLSLLVVSKCALEIFSTFFGKHKPIFTVVTSLFVSVTLMLVMCYWLSRSHSALFRNQTWYIEQRFVQNDYQHIKPPAYPDGLNIVHVLSFGGGILGAIVAICTYCYPELLGGNRKYYLLAIVAIVLALLGVLWKFTTRVPLHALMREMADSARTSVGGPNPRLSTDSQAGYYANAPGRTVRISVTNDHRIEEELPAVDRPSRESESLNLIGNPALVHSSSSEAGIELQPVPEKSEELDDYHPPVTRLSYVTPDAYSAASIVSRPSVALPSQPKAFSINISAVQGLEFMDGLWQAKTVFLK